MTTTFSTGECLLGIRESYTIIYCINTDNASHVIQAALKRSIKNFYYLCSSYNYIFSYIGYILDFVSFINRWRLKANQYFLHLKQQKDTQKNQQNGLLKTNWTAKSANDKTQWDSKPLWMYLWIANLPSITVNNDN